MPKGHGAMRVSREAKSMAKQMREGWGGAAEAAFGAKIVCPCVHAYGREPSRLEEYGPGGPGKRKLRVVYEPDPSCPKCSGEGLI